MNDDMPRLLVAAILVGAVLWLPIEAARWVNRWLRGAR